MSTATIPALVLEFAPNDGPFVASPTWIDLSSFLKAPPDLVLAEWTQGKPDPMGQYEPGVLRLMLCDLGRVLDPTNTSSIYNGKLHTDVQVRLSATWAATTYREFRGHLARSRPMAGPGWNEGWREWTVIEATGFLNRVPVSRYSRKAVEYAATRYWSLDENPPLPTTAAGVTLQLVDILGQWTPTPAGAAVFIDSVDGRKLYSTSAVDDAAISQDGLCDDGSSVYLNGSTQVLATQGPDDAANPVTNPLSFAFWMKMPAPADSSNSAVVFSLSQIVQVALSNPTSQLTLQVVVQPTGNVAVFVSNADGTSHVSLTGTRRVDDGSPHMIAVTRSGTSWVLYVDGTTEVVSGTGSGVTIPFSNPILNINVNNASSAIKAFIDGIAIFDGTAVSSSNINDLYLAGSAITAGDAPGARLSDVFASAGWPATLTSFAPGYASLSAAIGDGDTVTTHAQLVAGSEDGALFCWGDGTVVFEDRMTLAARRTGGPTFGDGGGSELPYERVVPDQDVQFIANQVAVSAVGFPTKSHLDITSRDAHGVKAASRSTVLSTVDQMVQLAKSMVRRYKDDQQRIDEIVLQGELDPTNLWPVILRGGATSGTVCKLQQRVTVKRRPPGGGSVTTQPSFVTQMRHTVTATEWKTTWRLMPSDPWDSLWLLGDATYGKLGTTNRLGY